MTNYYKCPKCDKSKLRYISVHMKRYHPEIPSDERNVIVKEMKKKRSEQDIVSNNGVPKKLKKKKNGKKKANVEPTNSTDDPFESFMAILEENDLTASEELELRTVLDGLDSIQSDGIFKDDDVGDISKNDKGNLGIIRSDSYSDCQNHIMSENEKPVYHLKNCPAERLNNLVQANVGADVTNKLILMEETNPNAEPGMEMSDPTNNDASVEDVEAINETNIGQSQNYNVTCIENVQPDDSSATTEVHMTTGKDTSHVQTDADGMVENVENNYKTPIENLQANTEPIIGSVPITYETCRKSSSQY